MATGGGARMRSRLNVSVASVFRVFGALGVLYVVVSLLAWKYQERLAFPGPRNRLPSPADFGIRDGEMITVTTGDGVRLRGWYLPPSPAPAKGKRAPGLIWFYGNMETIRAMGAVIRDFRPPGTGVVVLDYRGYGESDGSETEVGVYRDAEAAWAYLSARPEIDSTRLAVYGRSVGSVPALYLAERRPVRAVVLDSPFTRALDMAKEHYPWLPRFLVNLSLDNLTRAKSLRVPLLIFHGADDRLAPLSMGVKMATAGRGDLVVLAAAGHNDTYDVGGLAYRDRVRAFLAEALGPRQ
ncbi:MAG: alpha/beta fold hydrolase [Gemmatimonadetes bacterium]|nr:alpha/beta fold hydrolase [Gemmatimonadota bacterium]